MIKEKVVLYLRLSQEDGDDESSSITNQRKILMEYAKQNNMEVADVYIDDGVSGYSMNRPAFNRLKKDLNDGKVNTIIVKDLSRLGRHNVKVQLFLENLIEDGKRIIAIGDNYDTSDESTHDMVGIKTWINERYIIDTSKKIRKSISTLQKEGKYISSVPYGYKKDIHDKTKYTIDPLIAPYVKQIFEMYIGGMGVKLIARELTNQNIPTPSIIKKQYTEDRGAVSKRKVSSKWDVKVIQTILKNEFYVGTLVMGRNKSRSINGKQISVPEENWIKFPDAHEPIIDRHTFQLAQEIMKTRSFGNYRGKKIQTRDNIFAGVLYCADCGSRMTSSGGIENTRYICKAYNVYGTSACTSHGVNEAMLTEAILEFLEHCKNNLEHVLKDISQIIQAEMSNRSIGHSDIQQLIDRLDKAKQSIKTLVEQKIYETMQNPNMIDVINQTYNNIQNEKYQEIKSLEKQIEDMQNIEIDETNIRRDINFAISIIDNALTTKKLTKKQILTLVNKINVYEDGGLDIYLRGNLHELCHNYFKVGETKMRKIKTLLYDFILQNPDKIITRNAAFYIRESGVKLTFETLSKIIKEELLAKNIVVKNPMNRGYRLVGSLPELQRALIYNNVEVYTRRLANNNDIFKTLISISNWVNEISDSKKKLF